MKIAVLVTWVRAGEGPDFRLEGQLDAPFSRVPIAGEDVTLNVEGQPLSLAVESVWWGVDARPTLLLADLREEEATGRLSLDQLIAEGYVLTNPIPREE